MKKSSDTRQICETYTATRPFRYLQERLESCVRRRATVGLAPSTMQIVHERFRPTKVRLPASITPEPTKIPGGKTGRRA